MLDKFKEEKRKTSRASLKIYRPATPLNRTAPGSRARGPESKQGQTVDALALGGDEGRDKLRKARGRRK